MPSMNSITRKDIFYKLKKLGWVHERNSKHMIFSHPNSTKKISVPYRHNEGISPGTKRQILKIAESV